MAGNSRSLSLKQRGLTFEMIMWVFARLSALAMYAFFLVGLAGALWMGARNDMNFADVMRWAFMSSHAHVQATDVPTLEPWMFWFWRLLASGMFLTAASHGVHGLVIIADDYIVSAGARKFVHSLSIVAMLVMTVAGLYVLWTY